MMAMCCIYASRLFPDEARFTSGFVEAIARMGRGEEALKRFGTLREAYPDEPLYLGGYSRLLTQMDRHEDALEPVGRLADRIGTRIVFLAGHALLLGMYLMLGHSDLGFWVAVSCLGLLGAYYAATDGVVAAMASRLVPGHIRASGLALVTVVIAVAKMISAGLFGLLWQTLGRAEALTLYTALLAVAVAIGLVLVPGRQIDA